MYFITLVVAHDFDHRFIHYSRISPNPSANFFRNFLAVFLRGQQRNQFHYVIASFHGVYIAFFLGDFLENGLRFFPTGHHALLDRTYLGTADIDSFDVALEKGKTG